MAINTAEELRQFWDKDAGSYDNSPSHYPQRPHERAAWAAALRHLLPAPPARVLDAGAGTGFLSLLLAEQGYQVTALDIAAQMLERLRDKAERRGLHVDTVCAEAVSPPEGPFDAVVERHLIWTLPGPAAALAAWRAAAPAGRLVLIDGTWGQASGIAAAQAAARNLVHRIRAPAPEHHAEYSDGLRMSLPYGHGIGPAEAVALVEASPWGPARLERLRDVEWAVLDGHGLLTQLLGTHHRWAVTAGS